MELAIKAIITVKEDTQYKKINTLATLKLRGNHYRINQPIPIKIKFEDYALMTG